MSHFLRPDNQAKMRETSYAKWCAIWQTFIYPDRYRQADKLFYHREIIIIHLLAFSIQTTIRTSILNMI